MCWAAGVLDIVCGPCVLGSAMRGGLYTDLFGEV